MITPTALAARLRRAVAAVAHVLIALSVALPLGGAWGQSARADGRGNVAIGAVGPGAKVQVTIHMTREDAAVYDKGSTREKDRIIQRLSVEYGISLGAIRTFLSTIKGKDIPQSDWPQVLGELSRQFFELGQQISATPMTSTAIQDLVTQAEQARRAGDLAKADALLERAQAQASKAAKERREQARQDTRQAASLQASRGRLAFLRLEHAKGAQLLEQAVQERNDDLDDEVFWWVIDTGDAWLRVGRSGNALASFEAGMVIAQKLAAGDPGNSEWQRNLSVSHIRIGNAQVAQGDLGAAMASYKASMVIRQKLAASDPDNSEWQRGMSISHNKIGDIQVAQGDLGGAMANYQAGMVIAQNLAAGDPDNGLWQRDLSVSHIRIGNAQVAQGDLGAAMVSYQAGMVIAQDLAAGAPGNSLLQRDLSISHDRIGGVQVAQGDLAAALANFKAGMVIRQKLAASDPGNSQWQSDFAVSAWQLGTLPSNTVELRRAALQQGLDVVEQLRRQNKLASADAGFPELFRKALADLK
ncbi:MAG: hypothetical protein V4864_10595 [Pseudomonadota bacterium]